MGRPLSRVRVKGPQQDPEKAIALKNSDVTSPPPETVVDAADHSAPPEVSKPMISVSLLVDANDSQAVMDRLSAVLDYREDARIILLPVEAVLPKPTREETDKARKRGSGFRGISREELYEEIADGAALDHNYILLVVFSALATAIGLVADNVAVVIGAMVIAPLLGPNLALAFSTVQCDLSLMWRAIRTNLAGILGAMLIAALLGFFWPFEPTSHELISRTRVGFDAIALALVAGAAGVLSLTRGVSSVLVGVMVAVALMPPTITLGIMLAKGYMEAATGAAILLAVNVVSINLAANIVFWIKGVKPRGWHEKRAATKTMLFYGAFWLVALGGLSVAISYHDRVFKQKALSTPISKQLKTQ